MIRQNGELYIENEGLLERLNLAFESSKRDGGSKSAQVAQRYNQEFDFICRSGGNKKNMKIKLNKTFAPDCEECRFDFFTICIS